MRIRWHGNYGHGLRPGETKDMNCPNCKRMNVPDEVMQAVRDRRRQLRGQLTTAESLSEPCTPGRTRWADLDTSGYRRKPEDVLAADRERNRQLALDLKARIAVIDSWLAEKA